LEGKEYSSEEIDWASFSASKAQGKSLYYVEEDKIASHVFPDLVITQDA
jgi:iron complex transport system substrate-binding protein